MGSAITVTSPEWRRQLQGSQNSGGVAQNEIVNSWLTEVKNGAKIIDNQKHKNILNNLADAMNTAVIAFNETGQTPTDFQQKDIALKNLNNAIDQVEKINKELPLFAQNKYTRGKMLLTISTFAVPGLLKGTMKPQTSKEVEEPKSTPRLKM